MARRNPLPFRVPYIKAHNAPAYPRRVEVTGGRPADPSTISREFAMVIAPGESRVSCTPWAVEGARHP